MIMASSSNYRGCLMVKGMIKVMVNPDPSAVAIIAGVLHPRRDCPCSNPPKAKGKGKGKKGLSRSSSRQSACIHMKGKGKKKGYQNKGKGKGKNKGKNGKSIPSWRPRSRSTTASNPRMKWGGQGASRAISVAAAKQIQRTAALKEEKQRRIRKHRS